MKRLITRAGDLLPAPVAVSGAAAILTLTAVIPAESRIALAMPGHTLAVVGATVGAILGHVLCDSCVEGELLLIPVVVVHREEPVPGLHILGYIAANRGLLGDRGGRDEK